MRKSVAWVLVFLLFGGPFVGAEDFNADINRDRFVNEQDLAVLSGQWLSFQPAEPSGSGGMILDTLHTWLVAKSGDNANSGHPSGFPVNLATDAKLTVQAAIDAASPGDTILIWPGTYAENVTVSKTLQLIGFGYNATVIQSATTHALQLSSSGAASGTRLKDIGAVTTASGVYYGINLGFNNNDCVLEDCYGEGDYDGIHLRNSNRTTLLRCYGKGHFDGIQAGSGEGHRIIDCTGETDGTNAIEAEVNGFVCVGATGLIIKNLYCKARRSLAGDTKHLTGCLIKGDALIDGLIIDVEHTGTGNHQTKGLSIDAGGGRATVRNLHVVAETDTGDLFGVYVGDTPNTAQIENFSINLTSTGGGTVYGAYCDDHVNSMGVLIDGQLVLSIPAGTTSSVTGQVVGFEKSRFVDAGPVGTPPDDFWNGYLALWTGGANAGESQGVDDFITATDEFRFAADFTNAIQVGDAYTLYNGGVPASYDLYNAGGTLSVAQVAHDETNTFGDIDYLAPVGVAGGAANFGAFRGDESVKLSDFWARKY